VPIRAPRLKRRPSGMQFGKNSFVDHGGSIPSLTRHRNTDRARRCALSESNEGCWSRDSAHL
jgi:hypothetical protein